VLAAAAFCPHPPLIVPEVAAGAAAELDGLRAACDLAVARMLAARPVLVVVVGAGPVAARWTAGAAGTLAGYGVDVTVPLDGQAGHGGTGLPLSVTVGAWLLARAGWAGERVAVTVPAAASDSELSDVAAQVVGFASHAAGSRNEDQALIADLDGNGRPEVIVPRQSRETLVALELDGSRFVERWSINLRAAIESNLLAADVDGDGLLDLVVADGRALYVFFSVR